MLHFSHASPIDELIQLLQKKLCDYDRGKLAQHLEIDKDMNTLLERIEKGEAFEKHHLARSRYFIV